MGKLIMDATNYASAAHLGQVRRFTGGPYIAHPVRVAGLLQRLLPTATPEMVAAALLHDVVEDTDKTKADIERAFGPVVAFLVWELSKPNQPESISAMCIKACDLIDNLSDLADVAPRAQAAAYLSTKSPQVLKIAEWLRAPYPDLVMAMLQAWQKAADEITA